MGKLTDNEIKKALEDIIKHLDFTQIKSGENVLANALDLINCQQAEIEKLNAEREEAKHDIEKALGELKEFEISYEKDIQTAKAEAIKEFANRLKEKSEIWEVDEYFNYVKEEHIDNLLKEMVGE